MSEEINAVIDNLCIKLGTASQVLIPELAKYHIATTISALVICIVLLIVSAWICRKSIKIVREDEFDTAAAIGLMLSVVVIIVLVICIGVQVVTLVGWIASPTVSAIEDITRMVR